MQEGEFHLTDTQKAQYYDHFFGNDLTELEWDGKCLGVGACAGKPHLRKVSMPNVEIVRKNAFRDSDALEVVDLPRATQIGSYAFRGCKSLKTIKCSSVGSIGIFAFRKCSSLEEASFDVASVIGRCAFQNCDNLKIATFQNATYVGRLAFGSCKNLEKISLPNVRVIDERAFDLCVSLKEIELPKATIIGDGAFNECMALKKVVLDNEIGTEFLEDDVFQSTNCLSGTTDEVFNPDSSKGSIIVPEDLMDYYKSHSALIQLSNALRTSDELALNEVDEG